MSYHNNNNNNNNSRPTYSSPDVGGYSNVTSAKELDFVYLLPTGDVWTGEVHQMDDGTYMTGKAHNATSIIVVKASLTPEYPNEGLVGKSDIFKTVFEKVGTWSRSSEATTENIIGKLDKLQQTIEELNTLLNLSKNKIAAFIQGVNIHNENAGNGQILDHNLDYTLDAHSITDHKSRISSIEYEHGSSDPFYIFDGFVDTGMTNEGLSSIDTSAIRLDMVSRTGAPVAPEIDNLLMGYDLAPGFNGKIVVTLSQSTVLTNINLPTNGLITAVSLDEGETLLTNWSNFEPISVSKIFFYIEYTAPEAFVSYITNDFTEDLLGNPQTDQAALDPGAYQKSSLNIGKLNLNSISYKPDKEFEMGPYDVKAGSLRSITINPIEEVEGYTDFKNYFSYKLVIGGEEYPISPWNREGDSPRIYYININLPDDIKSGLAANQGVGFIDTNNPEISFKVKATLTRPEDQYISPILKGVTFNYSTSLDGGYNG